jgi:hypothetical protein
MRMRSYLGLGASTTDGVNPDVLSLDATALVQGHVLHELSTPHASQYVYFLSGSTAIVEIQSIKNQTHILRVGDDS